MELGLKDKVVVVTGASKGIGFAIAEAFLQEGAYVVISGRNEQAAQRQQAIPHRRARVPPL